MTTTLREMYCPFPSLLNPHTQVAQRETAAWAARMRLVPQDDAGGLLATERYTELVGRLYPRADRETLQLLSDWTTWLFLHDDVCDKTPMGAEPAMLRDEFAHFGAILAREVGPRVDRPLDSALVDLRERFRALAPETDWFLRMSVSVHQYFEACVWEAANRKANRVPSRISFEPMRRYAGGMWIYYDFLELANRETLPLGARCDATIVRLQELTGNVACWTNDLFSFEKESACGDVHSLVLLLLYEGRLKAAEALEEVMRRCEAEVHEFVSLELRLDPELGTDCVRRFLEGLKTIMRGNLDWSQRSGRYSCSLSDETTNKIDSYFASLRPARGEAARVLRTA
ncbi:MAG: hypothetical protein JW940_01975 [Polyangiaceae bacterium]|nr:hypothetical protein [Polyangiaceae bacterium]